jgi:hypothetical protein
LEEKEKSESGLKLLVDSFGVLGAFGGSIQSMDAVTRGFEDWVGVGYGTTETMRRFPEGSR